MNLINYGSVVEEADMILSVLSQNKGAFPDFEGEQGGRLPHNMSRKRPMNQILFRISE